MCRNRRHSRPKHHSKKWYTLRSRRRAAARVLNRYQGIMHEAVRRPIIVTKPSLKWYLKMQLRATWHAVRSTIRNLINPK